MLPSTLARALAAFAGALCLLLFTSAQAPVAFNPDKDLEGFEASTFSEFSDLYAYADFLAAKGKPLAPAELEALRMRWKAERARVDQEIARIQADPREKCVHNLKKALALHSYFSKIDYTLERPDPGLVFLVQRPAKEDPAYAARIVAFYAPFVQKLAANFETSYAQPLGLKRREGHEVIACAVLASKGDYANALQLLDDPVAPSAQALYDYKLKLALTCEDSFSSGGSVAQQRAELLRQVARELLQAYLGVSGNRPGSIWLYEGLPNYLSWHEGAAPDSLDKHTPHKNAAKWMGWVLSESGNADLLLLPLDQLAGLRSYAEYKKTVLARAKALGRQTPGDNVAKTLNLETPAENVLSGAFYGQHTLWMYYLHDGAQGLYRKPFLEFLKSAMTGRGDTEDLRRAFTGIDTRAISRDFVRYAAGEYERQFPGKKVDRAAIDPLFTDAPLVTASTTPGAGGAPPPEEPSPIAESASFSPAKLAPDASDVEAQHALALLQARGGDIDGALALLKELAKSAPKPPEDQRVQRDLARLAELAKLRQGYLEFLKSSGGRLAFKAKGANATAPVVGFENGVVKLGESKSGVASLPLGEVDPYEVAKQAGKKEAQGGAQPWTRAYAYVLAGDERWDKVLKDDSPGARELREDIKGWYPALLETAKISFELFALSRQPLPRDAAEANSALASLRTLLTGHKNDALLARKTNELRQFATACLAATRASGDATGLLHAKTERMDDGRTRFTWEFDNADEAADWRRQAGYLKTWRDRLPKLAVSEADSRFTVEKGHFRGLGQICYRSAASFTGPITVRLRYRRESTTAEHSTVGYFVVMLCDDGAGSNIMTGDPGYIRVRDVKQDYEREAHSTEKGVYYLDQDSDFEIVHDGKEVSTSLDTQPLARCGCGPRTNGYVVLFTHVEFPVSIERIVIEGQLMPASLRDLESRWIAEQLAALGFP